MSRLHRVLSTSRLLETCVIVTNSIRQSLFVFESIGNKEVNHQ